MWDEGAPWQIHLEPSDKCNAACPMCPRYTKDGFEVNTLANTEWTLEEFKKSFPEDFIKNWLHKILSCGNFGDPCACRDLSKIYQYAREVNPGIALAINTNGSLRTTDWWYDLGTVMRHEQNPGNYCTFSIDGLEDTNHIYRRNTKFNKIIENAKAYIEAGGIAHWDFIVFEHNEHQIEEARTLAKQMGFQNFNIKRTGRWASYHEGQGHFPVYTKGEYQYDLKQPKDEVFKHNYEDATLFKNQDRQSFNLEDFRNLSGKPISDQRYVNGKWKTINLRKLTIDCRATPGDRVNQNYNEIYVAANGFLSPCCFLGSEPFKDENRNDANYIQMVKLDGGVDAFNIKQNNIYDVINKDLFRKMIPWSWKKKGNLSMRPKKCGACCGVEWNCLDYGELGDKTNSYIEDDNEK